MINRPGRDDERNVELNPYLKQTALDQDRVTAVSKLLRV